MKRYTKEFINDQITTAKRWFYPCKELDAAIASVRKYEAFCAKGLISDLECIEQVIKILNPAK